MSPPEARWAELRPRSCAHARRWAAPRSLSPARAVQAHDADALVPLRGRVPRARAADSRLPRIDSARGILRRIGVGLPLARRARLRVPNRSRRHGDATERPGPRAARGCRFSNNPNGYFRMKRIKEGSATPGEKQVTGDSWRSWAGRRWYLSHATPEMKGSVDPCAALLGGVRISMGRSTRDSSGVHQVIAHFPVRILPYSELLKRSQRRSHRRKVNLHIYLRLRLLAAGGQPDPPTKRPRAAPAAVPRRSPPQSVDGRARAPRSQHAP